MHRQTQLRAMALEQPKIISAPGLQTRHWHESDPATAPDRGQEEWVGNLPRDEAVR